MHDMEDMEVKFITNQFFPFDADAETGKLMTAFPLPNGK